MGSLVIDLKHEGVLFFQGIHYTIGRDFRLPSVTPAVYFTSRLHICTVHSESTILGYNTYI